MNLNVPSYTEVPYVKLYINMSLPSGMAATLMFNWDSKSNCEVSSDGNVF